MTKQDVNLKAFVRKNYAWLVQARDAGTLTMRGLSRRVEEAYGVSVEPRLLSVVMSQVKKEKSASENTAENDIVVAMRVDNKPPVDQALVSTLIDTSQADVPASISTSPAAGTGQDASANMVMSLLKAESIEANLVHADLMVYLVDKAKTDPGRARSLVVSLKRIASRKHGQVLTREMMM